MSIIKPSEAFKASADWSSGDVRSYMKDQTPLAVDTVADVNNNDFESARWLFVKANGGTYRLNLSSVATDDGDGVLQDSIGRRYQKIVTTGAGSPWDVQVAELSDRDAFDDEDPGFVVLVSDVGDGRAAAYTMGDGGSADWSDPAYFTGPGLDGSPGSSDVVGTSTSSVAIGTGSKTFTIIEDDRGWGVGARLRVSSDANGANFMSGLVTSYSGNTLQVSVDLVGGSGTHADWTINLAGERGANGTNGTNGTNGSNGSDGADPSILLNWNTGTADADPGAGKIRANNASLASAGFLYVSEASRGGSDIEAFLLSLDNSTNTVKGTLVITDPVTEAQATFDVTGVTDATDYVKVAVSGHSGATSFADDLPVSFQFSRAGDKGSDGAGSGDVVGPASAVDSRVAAFDGTDGKLLKDGGYTVAGLRNTDNHTDGSTNGVYTLAERSKLAAIEAGADVTDAGNVGSSIHGASGKTTPVDADTLPIIDSEASNVLKKLTFANLWAWVQAKFNGTAKSTPVAADRVYIGDSAASNVAKYSTFTQIMTLVGALINGSTDKSTPVDADQLVIADSAASQATKKLTLTNLFVNYLSAKIFGTENVALTGGVTVTSKSLGTQSSGTLTLDMGDRPLQHYTNNGAHTLAPGSVVGSCLVDVTNGASAGAITTSGWTKVAGDSFTTTNAHIFRCHCSVGNGGSLLIVQAMQ